MAVAAAVVAAAHAGCPACAPTIRKCCGDRRYSKRHHQTGKEFCFHTDISDSSYSRVSRGALVVVQGGQQATVNKAGDGQAMISLKRRDCD
jgi:hypothetical protein